jgi:integrase
MANKPGHRRFGNIRQLPSGRYQIRYPGPDGRMRTGTETYERLSSAKRALTLIEAQLVTGQWTDPVAGKERLRSYADRWIAHHAGLRPRTIELYSWLLATHIAPYIGAMQLGSITPDVVREWRAALLGAGVSQTATAKAYRLLRAILMTATEDRIVPRNPCRIRGGGDEKPPERPVLTIAQVLDLANHMAARRYRALILLATFASLRWGEAIALRQCDLDLAARTVSIRRQYVETNGHLMIAPPKSRAGIRTVAFPATLIPELREHLDTYAGPENTALVFTGQRGAVLRRGNFRKASGWSDAVAAIGLPGLHFHDLRHTGNTLAAQAGVSLADLKARMGHDSVRAAMIYQHAAAEADQKIANTLEQRMGEARDDARGQS